MKSILITTDNKKQLQLLQELAQQMGMAVEQIKDRVTKEKKDEEVAFHHMTRHRKNPAFKKHL